MNDVERWLVDKEGEKQEEKESESESLRHASSTDNVKDEIHDLRDEVVELQGRSGEVDREMSKIATAPSNLSVGPKTQFAAVSVAPQTASSIVTHSHPSSSIATHSTGSPPGLSTPIHHKYYCEGIYESADDFEEERVGHEVTLPYRRLRFSS